MAFGPVFVSTVVLGITAVSTWALGPDRPAILPEGDYEPRRPAAMLYDDPDAESRRLDALRRATFRLDASELSRFEPPASQDLHDPLTAPVPACRFVVEPPSGTSPKFDCVFPGGEVVKVKYGRSPEIHAEAAATRLMQRLGYPADTVTILPRLRCYGCPRLPFLAMRLQAAFNLPLIPPGGHDDGYTDFEWVGVERKFPARPIETTDTEGWAWWELSRSDAPRAEVDALRLAAVFLAHWDNKSENQRLVCVDDMQAPGDVVSAGSATGDECRRPVAMLQDLGATFGPGKVNLARWSGMPIWQNRAECLVSMRALPFDGATFPDAVISEEGRALLAERLASIADGEIERLFSEARFPQFQAGTADERDLKAWTAAFRHRADQIINTRCA